MSRGVKYRLVFWSIVLVAFAVAYVTFNTQREAAMQRARIARAALDKAITELPVRIRDVRTSIATNARVVLIGAVESEKELTTVRTELERRLGSDAVSRIGWAICVEPKTSATTQAVMKQ